MKVKIKRQTGRFTTTSNISEVDKKVVFLLTCVELGSGLMSAPVIVGKPKWQTIHRSYASAVYHAEQRHERGKWEEPWQVVVEGHRWKRDGYNEGFTIIRCTVR